MSFKIERIYNNQNYTKESYIEHSLLDDWEDPCPIGSDGKVKCRQMRSAINDIVYLNNQIEDKRSKFLQENKMKIAEQESKISEIQPEYIKAKAKQVEAQNKIEEEIANAMEIEASMQKNVTKQNKMRADISKTAHANVEIGKKISGDNSLYSKHECSGNGEWSDEENKCICVGEWDPQFYCSQCKAGKTCDCPKGMNGNVCQYSDRKDCNGNGTVDYYGSCKCNITWKGKNCNIRDVSEYYKGCWKDTTNRAVRNAVPHSGYHNGHHRLNLNIDQCNEEAKKRNHAYFSLQRLGQSTTTCWTDNNLANAQRYGNRDRCIEVSVPKPSIGTYHVGQQWNNAVYKTF